MGIFKKRRIRSAYKFLSAFFKEGDTFYIGVSFEIFKKCPDLQAFGLFSDFLTNPKQIPKALKPVSKANKNGKWVRITPESKTTITRRIKYTRKKDKVKFDYERPFNVYKKKLLPPFNASFQFTTNGSNQQLVISEPLIYTESENTKNTHIINLFCEIFGEFEPLDVNFEYAVSIDEQLSKEILPAGSLSDDKVYESILSTTKKYLSKEAEIDLKDRLDFLKQYNPEFIRTGLNGSFGYLVFGLEDYGIVLLEKLKYGNATYIFDLKTYEEDIFKDKQLILKEKKYLKRIFHNDNWKDTIITYLSTLKK